MDKLHAWESPIFSSLEDSAIPDEDWNGGPDSEGSDDL